MNKVPGISHTPMVSQQIFIYLEYCYIHTSNKTGAIIQQEGMLPNTCDADHLFVVSRCLIAVELEMIVVIPIFTYTTLYHLSVILNKTKNYHYNYN